MHNYTSHFWAEALEYTSHLMK